MGILDDLKNWITNFAKDARKNYDRDHTAKPVPTEFMDKFALWMEQNGTIVIAVGGLGLLFVALIADAAR